RASPTIRPNQSEATAVAGGSASTPRAHRADHSLSSLSLVLGLDAVVAVGTRRPLTTVLAADHGETIRGGKRGHGWNLKTSGIRIPLAVSAPGLTVGRSTALASLVDVFPTVLAATGTPIDGRSDGISLIRLAAEGSLGVPRLPIVETWRLDLDGTALRDRLAVVGATHKLVHDFVGGTTRFLTLEEQTVDPQFAADMHAQMKNRLADYVVDAHGPIAMVE
ncbi:MAG: sulfatase-like hydrolase/transferase, partial [Nannocystaceae bacterium]